MRLRNIPGAKEAIENSPYVIQKPKELKGSWEAFFGRSGPVHIEVGMGKGRFIMDMARCYPEINYVGIEMYDSVLLRAIQKRERSEELPNLYFLRVDARELPEIFDENEVDRIYLNFSDPWPKDRHAKRRLTSRQFLERYEKILKSEGRIEFKTDNKDLFAFSLQEAGEAGWKIPMHTFDLHSDPAMCAANIMTEYEEKFSSLGNPICKLVLEKPEIAG